jgi:hypothetical protein
VVFSRVLVVQQGCVTRITPVVCVASNRVCDHSCQLSGLTELSSLCFLSFTESISVGALGQRRGSEVQFGSLWVWLPLTQLWERFGPAVWGLCRAAVGRDQHSSEVTLLVPSWLCRTVVGRDALERGHLAFAMLVQGFVGEVCMHMRSVHRRSVCHQLKRSLGLGRSVCLYLEYSIVRCGFWLGCTAAGVRRRV